MSKFNIKIADCVIGVETIHSYPQAFCKSFLTEDKPIYYIKILPEDIEHEKNIYCLYNSGKTPSNISLEIYNILRKVSDIIIDSNIFMMHGASIAVGNSAFLFTAISGTGKTTHLLRWLERLSNVVLINGDKPFIKINDDGAVLVCGSPWAGKENLYTNTMCPLKAIILMERAEDNFIEKISFSQAFPILLQQVYRPMNERKMQKTLKLLQQLNPRVSFYRFRCNNFKNDCFDVAYNALVGNE